MAERIVPAPSLTAVATPVDRFVSPLRQVAPNTNSMLEVAKALQTLNPAIQQFIDQKYTDYVAEEEAKGANAESYVDPSVALEKNREGWKSVIDQQRKIDRQKGTSTADRLAAASPHFQRGLLKSRAQRLGMALNDHLASLYARNPEVEVNGKTIGLHSVDDPSVVQGWVQQQTNAYVEKYGIGGLDPVLVSEVFTPLAAKSQANIVNKHSTLRLDRYQQEYMDEMSANAGMYLSTAKGSSDVDAFIRRLAGAESGGNYTTVNSLGYTGLLQFGQERLDDYNNAHGTNYTLSQFQGNATLQDEVNRWHIADIDSVIDEYGFLDKGWSRDGLRAVAHLGGIGGMKKFVMSGGEYNPKDAYGTSLSDYYNRFAGPALDLQGLLDEAIANGIDPTKANKNIVSTVINDAVAKRDPSVLSVLNDINAGSGPLGNIGWVQEAVHAAENKIADIVWEEETRAYTRQERERAAAAREISGQAFRSILDDPFGDHTDWLQLAIDSGNPDLVNAIRSMQNSVLDDIYTVRTNHEAYIELRQRIHTTTDPKERAALSTEIVHGTGVLWNKADAESLMDALESNERYSDYYDDDLVQQSIRAAVSTVKGRFGEKDFMGNVIGGDEESITAQNYMYDALTDFLEQNPEASRHQVRKAVREIAAEMLNSDEFNNPNAAVPPRKVGEIPSEPREDELLDAGTNGVPNVSLEGASVEQAQAFGRLLAEPEATLGSWDLEALSPEQVQLINQAATAMGMTAQAFIERFSG